MMIDDIDDRHVRAAFDRFGAESAAEAPLPDVAGVRRTARHRRTARFAVMALATALAVAAPLTVYVLAARIDPAFVAAPVTPDQITGATLVIPPWGVHTWQPSQGTAGCPTGLVQLSSKPVVPAAPDVRLVYRMDGNGDHVPATASVDVDGDGASELVALVMCVSTDVYLTQVIVVGRDEAGGLETLGQVVRASGTDPVKGVFDVRADGNGDVGALVGDLPGLWTPDPTSERQWRSYRYDGSRFRQVGGPREFAATAPPTDLAITMTPLRLGDPENGVRRGTTTVTVTNKGPAASPGLILVIGVSAGVNSPPTVGIDVPDATSCVDLGDQQYGPRNVRVCKAPALGAGETRAIPVELTVPASIEESVVQGRLRVSGTVKSEQPGIRDINDVDDYDNWTQVTGG